MAGPTSIPADVIRFRPGALVAPSLRIADASLVAAALVSRSPAQAESGRSMDDAAVRHYAASFHSFG